MSSVSNRVHFQFLSTCTWKTSSTAIKDVNSPLVLADIGSRTPSASSSVSGGPEVRLGERVLVVGQRTGVVQFYGKTSFAPGG